MTSLLSGFERVPVSSLELYPGNPRVGNLEVIAESLAANHQFAPIVVQRSTRHVLAGNHTLKAAMSLGWEHIDAVFVDVDDEAARKIVLSSNRTAEMGTYDEGALLELLSYLDGDLEGTGWNADDVERMLDETEPEDGDPDVTPPVPAEPFCQPGDLFLLGPHRLLIGDATNPEHLALVTEGLNPVGIVCTDPPYGISIVKGNGKIGSGGKFRGQIGSGKVVPTTEYMAVAGDETTDTARDAFGLLFAEYPDAAHVWWGANHYAASAGMPDASCWLVWDKQNDGNDFADCEIAWTNHPGAVRMLRHMWNGMLRASEHGKRVHPTQKPVALAEWAFSVIDPKAERGVVLDAFAGSGSTLTAAHRTGRTAALLELEPAYGDVIAQRWEQGTGIKPERVLADGSTEPVSFTGT